MNSVSHRVCLRRKAPVAQCGVTGRVSAEEDFVGMLGASLHGLIYKNKSYDQSQVRCRKNIIVPGDGCEKDKPQTALCS